MEERKKEKSRGFAAFGIPAGATLVFKKDPSVTVKTLDDKNKVEYQGRPYSISTLAKQLVGSPVSGYLYFKYNGKIIKSLAEPKAEPTVTVSASAEAEAAEPADPVEEASDGSNIDPLAEGWSGEQDTFPESAYGETGEE
jgi:hypothetical protein